MDVISNIVEIIKHEQPKVLLTLDEPLRSYTTFRIGGPVRLMLFPDSVSSLIEVCSILNNNRITPLILGNGSNILANDEKLDIVVVNTSRLNHIGITVDNDLLQQGYCDLRIEAGAWLSKITGFAQDIELSGFEFAHGIPGSLGGAVVMNAGAYGGEIKDVVRETAAFNVKTGRFTVKGEEHEFSYRQSRFSNTEDVVLASTIRLKKGSKKDIKKKMDELMKQRRENQPLNFPSGGSTFKRPKEGYAAALIEQAGLKGFTVGGAQVSEKHTGFIINREAATFSDVMSVIDHVQNVVLKKFGVQLELEVKVLR